MGARVLAALAAAAMVVGAVVIRSQVLEGDERAGSSSSGRQLVCARELPDGVCDEEADLDDTIDALLADEPTDFSWVAPGPWADAIAASGGSAFEETEPIAATDLVVVMFRTPPQCGTGADTWKCIGEAAAAGRVAAPSRATATRVLARAAMLGGFIGRTDYAINDLDEVPGALDFIAGVERGIEQARSRQASTLGDFVVRRGASADAFITTAAEAPATGAQVAIPEPLARVVATLASDDADADRVRDRLVSKNWTALTTAPETGLPSPGVLLALREVAS